MTDLNLLRSLVFLLEERSVTAAARRARVTQPAMSRTLARLRGQLGDPILVRTARGLVPTARAEGLALQARRALDDAEGLLGPAAPFEPATASGTFRIAATDFAFAALLPPLVAAFRSQAPSLDVVALPLPSGFEGDLEAGTVDLAIAFAAPTGGGMMAQVLFEDRLVCVARKGHPALRRLDLARYLRCLHLGLSVNADMQDSIDRTLAREGHARRVMLRTSQFLVAPAVLQGSDLVLTTGRRVAEALARLAPLQIAAAPIDLGTISVRQFWHERSSAQPAHAWLREQVKRCAAARRSG
jgi:DNA-binding transcriptional LysR family regulator